MTHDQLILLQSAMWLLFLAMFAIATAYLLAGLIKPAWVGTASRLRVVGRTLFIWFIGAAALAGTIAFTHSHPNGPHSVTRYIDDYFKEQCAQGADLPACKDNAAAPDTATSPPQ